MVVGFTTTYALIEYIENVSKFSFRAGRWTQIKAKTVIILQFE
jgi:hypothetical protein